MGLMGQDAFEFGVNLGKLLIFFLMMIQAVPLLVWVERRGSAFIQRRFGPNRVGPLGLFQLLADAIKFIFKESFIPQHAVKFLFLSAPVIALIPAALSFTALPLSSPVQVDAFEWLGSTWGPYNFQFRGIDMDIGIIYILGIGSLGAYGVLVAGWASGNKYSMLGAMRASAQMISYELALGLSIVGILMLYGTFDLPAMVTAQEGPLRFIWDGSEHYVSWLPNWGIFFQPLGALLFFIAAFAESNRLPFDLPESEGEIVAGFHTEYGGFKMLIFFMGEYGHMMVASGLFIIFYLGGYYIPFVPESDIYNGFLKSELFGTPTLASLMTALVQHLCFLAKLAVLLWVFVWVRWTLPRFRYDRLMDLGWKTMLPWALGNTFLTAIIVYFARRG
ncbi:MAG: NADH-quinone oxidoreductase subunit H [Bdellovibrionales bacterium]|nr:NADH-quinone oxidoreductase subunit H [Bdellovibrionales bacterium]